MWILFIPSKSSWQRGHAPSPKKFSELKTIEDPWISKGSHIFVWREVAVRRLAVFGLTLLLASSAALAQKKRVAVMDFEYGTVQRWWEGNWDIGKGITDMIVDELINDEARTFSVIERKQLDIILAEQNFSNSNRANPSSAAKIGQVLGVGAEAR